MQLSFILRESVWRSSHEISMFLPEFGIHCLYGQILVINLVLHVVQLLQEVQGAVEMVQVYDIQFQALSNIRPIQDGGIQLTLKTKFILEYSIRIIKVLLNAISKYIYSKALAIIIIQPLYQSIDSVNDPLTGREVSFAKMFTVCINHY